MLIIHERTSFVNSERSDSVIFSVKDFLLPFQTGIQHYTFKKAFLDDKSHKKSNINHKKVAFVKNKSEIAIAKGKKYDILDTSEIVRQV